MKMRNTVLACVLSFVVGGVITGCVLGSKFLYWMKIVSFGHCSGEIAIAIDRAEEAYFNEPPVVAVWELKKLLQRLADTEESISRMGKDPQFDMRDFHKDNWAVAGARLIRTYEKMGDHQEADRCVSNYLSKVHMFGGGEHYEQGINTVYC